MSALSILGFIVLLLGVSAVLCLREGAAEETTKPDYDDKANSYSDDGAFAA